MRNIDSLKKIFNEYAGKEIKHPNRVTCDIDSTMMELGREVNSAGFLLGRAHEKGAPDTGRRMVPGNWVSPEFEKGADGRPRLTGNFKLGN